MATPKTKLSHYRWYWYGADGWALNGPPKRLNRYNLPISPEERDLYYPKAPDSAMCKDRCCN